MKPGCTKAQMAQRAAKEIRDGMYVNMGIGLPSLIPDFLVGRDVVIHSENGLLGMGPMARPGEEDPDLVNAGKQPVTILPGGAICSQVDSFAMIRGGHLDMTFLGAFQVSEKGDLANWHVPGARVPGVGGAMDLVTGTKHVVVLMTHITKKGEKKIVKECTYPLTGRRCVNTIITDLAVIRVTPKGLLLEEVAPGWTPEEIQELTEPTLFVSDDLKQMC